MNQIDAIYQDGVFKPLGPVTLTENQRVQLQVQPVEKEDPLVWLERVRKRRDAIAEREGLTFDSTREIALDR